MSLHVVTYGLLTVQPCTYQVFSAIVRNVPLDMEACCRACVKRTPTVFQREGFEYLQAFVGVQRGRFRGLLPLSDGLLCQKWPLYFHWMHTFIEEARLHNEWVERRVQEERRSGRKGAARQKRENQIRSYKTKATFNLLPMPNFTHNYMSIGMETLLVCFGVNILCTRLQSHCARVVELPFCL